VNHCYCRSSLSTRTGRRLSLLLLVISGALRGGLGDQAWADEPLRLKAKMPKDQAIVGGKPGGYYYAAKSLKEEYDKLLGRVQTLRAEIGSRKISSQEATAQVLKLQEDLQKVRQLIDASKTFISPGVLETKTETIEFGLGPEQLLFLNNVAKVRLVGWEQPHVKCVLEKIIIGDGKQPLDDHFAGIRVVHRHGLEPEVVGRSAAERQADEIAFLASPDGKRLTDDQRATRAAWMTKAFAPNGFFQLFQSRPIDCIELEGLTHQQGNRQIQFEVKSRGGDGMSGSMWQRHASLTIFVPKCRGLGVRGGTAGLEAEGLKAPLIVRGDGDRDYNSQSHVRDHEGPLTVENVQLQTIKNVHGDVSVTVTADLGNSGTEHSSGQITQYSEAPATYNYREIDGNFRALLLKVNLQLAKVSGRVDVNNQFGDTLLVVESPLAAAAHRIVSESGGVTLQLAMDALNSAPLVAATECGTVRVMENTPPLVDGNITAWHEDGTVRRTYRGFATKSNAQPPFDRFGPFERMETILLREGQQKPGLDVLSRAGAVLVEPIPK
jgi:hypothetical protein